LTLILRLDIMFGKETTKDQPDFTGLVKVKYDWSFDIFCDFAPLPLDLGSNYQKEQAPTPNPLRGHTLKSKSLAM
jgi:hypothetical protein